MDATQARSSLYHLHEAGRIAEAAYEESQGELTPEVSAVEHLHGLAVESAVESLAALVASARASKAGIALEIERLKAMSDEAGDRIEWAEDKLLPILEQGDVRKMQVGTFMVKIKAGRERVVIPDGFDVRSLPAECLRHKPETYEVDKNKTRSWVKDNPDEEHGGLTVERGPDTVEVK